MYLFVWGGAFRRELRFFGGGILTGVSRMGYYIVIQYVI